MSKSEDGSDGGSTAKTPDECPACQLAALMPGGALKCTAHSAVVIEPPCPACALAAQMPGGQLKCTAHRKKKEVKIECIACLEAAATGKSKCLEHTLASAQERRAALPKVSRLIVENMCCDLEVQLIHTVLEHESNVEWVRVNALAKSALVRHIGPVQPVIDVLNRANLGARLADIKYDAAKKEDNTSTESEKEKEVEKPCYARLKKDTLIAGLLVLACVTWILGIAIRVLRQPLLTSITIFGILCALYRAIQVARVRRCRSVDMNVLVIVASVGAALAGTMAEASSIVIVFFAAELIERQALRRVTKMLEIDADMLSDNSAAEGNSYVAGDSFELKAGDRVPCDAVVESGSLWLDEARFTGESENKKKAKGDVVLAGTVTTNGQATLTALDTSISKSQALAVALDDATTSTKKRLDPGSKIASIMAPLALGLALILICIPFLRALLLNKPPRDVHFFLRAALLMCVCSCPCALTLAKPAPLIACVSAIARRGLVVTNSDSFLSLATTRVFALDKTGTLTLGASRLVEAVPLGGDNEVELSSTLRLAAAVEAKCTHPIAAAVVQHVVGHVGAATAKLLPEATDFRLLRGGVTGTVGKTRITIGAPGKVLKDQNAGDLLRYDAVVILDGVPRAGLRIEDQLRPSAPAALAAITKLPNKHRRTAILTGDRADRAEPVRDRLVGLVNDYVRETEGSDVPILRIGADDETDEEAPAVQPSEGCVIELSAGLSPEEKKSWIREEQSANNTVAMVGDGVNDALALKQADVGIAFGPAAADVAVDAADLVVLSNDLSAIPELFRAAAECHLAIKQNIGIAILTKLATLILLLLKPQFGLGVALLADLVSLLLVVANGLRHFLYWGKLSAAEIMPTRCPSPLGRRPAKDGKVSARTSSSILKVQSATGSKTTSGFKKKQKKTKSFDKAAKYAALPSSTFDDDDDDEVNYVEGIELC